MKNPFQLFKPLFWAIVLSLVPHSKATANPFDLDDRYWGISRKVIAIQYYDTASKNEKVEIEIQRNTDNWQKVHIVNGDVYPMQCIDFTTKVVKISTLNENKENKTDVYTLSCGERYGIIWNPQKSMWAIYNLKPKNYK